MCTIYEVLICISYCSYKCMSCYSFAVETPEGTYSTDGQTVVLCPLGTYQDMTAQTSCKPCPSGTTTPGVGAEHVTECTGKVLIFKH